MAKFHWGGRGVFDCDPEPKTAQMAKSHICRGGSMIVNLSPLLKWQNYIFLEGRGFLIGILSPWLLKMAKSHIFGRGSLMVIPSKNTGKMSKSHIFGEWILWNHLKCLAITFNKECSSMYKTRSHILVNFPCWHETSLYDRFLHCNWLCCVKLQYFIDFLVALLNKFLFLQQYCTSLLLHIQLCVLKH